MDAWRPWTPTEAARRLRDFDRPWCVAGGWAVDLFLGQRTRPHDDLEVAVLEPDLCAIRRCLSGFVFHAVGDGTVRRLGDDDDEVHDEHQHWVLDERAAAWRVDVMVEPGDDRWWAYRRHPGLRRLRSTMVARSPEGIPFLRPEGVLLHKSTRRAAKDDADFDACLPSLDEAARSWLVAALRAVHPDHVWLERL